MKRFGFTVVEVLICLAIIVIIAALSFPVATAAKHSAQIESSLSNLHQLQIALVLYQGDQDLEKLTSGKAPPSLPSSDYVYKSRLQLQTKTFQSPCGQNPSWEDRPTVIQYDYLPDTGLDDLETAWNKYQDKMVVFADFNCANHGEPLYSGYVDHRILGVRLSGDLLNINKPGDARFQAWWNPLEK